MVDADLIHKRIAFIETCVREPREIADPSRLGHDVREERFIAHTLQFAIQAALDIASRVVSAGRFGEPTTNRNLFDLLERANWLPAELATRLRDMAGFRNVVVHGYESAISRSCATSWTTAWMTFSSSATSCASEWIARDSSLSGDTRAQMRRCFSNIIAVLEDAGMGIPNLVKLTVFITDTRDVALFRETRDQMLGGHLCASTPLVVSALASPDWTVEIEAVAAS